MSTQTRTRIILAVIALSLALGIAQGLPEATSATADVLGFF